MKKLQLYYFLVACLKLNGCCFGTLIDPVGHMLEPAVGDNFW